MARSKRRRARRPGTAAETRPRPRFHDRTGTAAPVLQARGYPSPLSPGAYIYPPGVFQRGISRALGVVVICF